MLSACGGGGGHGGHIPTTTLPDTPDNPSTNTCSANPETCMTTQKFSNAEKRIELYKQANKDSTPVAKMRRMKVVARSANGFADVDTAYKTMKDILIDGNTANSPDDLRHSLLLAGFSAEDLPNDDLENWTEINSLTIKDKAQKIWDMYGEAKDVDMANAKLNSVDIKSTKQDSFVNFMVNDSGKITGLQFDIETDSSGNRTMTFKKDGDGKFTRTGDLYVMQFPISKESTDSGSSSLELELLEDVTAKNIDNVKKKLIAKLYEHKSEHHELNEKIFNDTLKNIENLDFETFTKMKEELKDKGFYFGGKRTTVINYASKAKDIGEKGLQYSDFGLITLSGEQANGPMEQPEYSVFAGGYEVKRIDASKFATQTMEFDGKAVAAVEYQKEQENVENRESQSDRFDGTAHLLFDKGNETLTAKFDKWYDVEVKSNGNKDNYDISFTNGERIENPHLKFSDGDKFETKDFVGKYQNDGQGEQYGSADFGYYGDGNLPTEATGYITYGKEMSNNQGGADGLNMQIGFGTQRTK